MLGISWVSFYLGIDKMRASAAGIAALARAMSNRGGGAEPRYPKLV